MRRILPALLAACLLLNTLPFGALASEMTETTVAAQPEETTESAQPEETTAPTEETQPENLGHIHCACTGSLFSGGADDCIAADHKDDRQWYAWSDPNSLPQYNSPVNDKDGNPVSGAPRYYYLTTDVTVSGSYASGGKTYICLNGHSVTVSGGITINADTFIVDCQAKFDSEGYLASENGITGAIKINNHLRLYGVTLKGNTSSAVSILDYRTLTAKFSAFKNNAASAGGAITMLQSTVNIDKCLFTGNTATGNGGAIELFGASGDKNEANVTIKNSKFKNNTAGDKGGAIAVTNNAMPTLTIQNCVFEENKADSGVGGAIYSSKSKSASTDIAISGSTFKKNSAKQGGAIGMMFSGQQPLALEGCTFTGNTAKDYGGAIMTECGTVTISGGSFKENSAPKGGAIYMHEKFVGPMNISDASFTGNSATGGGAGIYMRGGNLNLDDVSMTGNTNSGANGAALQIGDDAKDSLNKTLNVTLHDCTITGNTSTNKYNVYRGGVSVFASNSNLTVSGKTVIKNNAAGTDHTLDNRGIVLREAGTKLTVGKLTEGSQLVLTTGKHDGNDKDDELPVDDLTAFLKSNSDTVQFLVEDVQWLIYENRVRSGNSKNVIGYRKDSDTFYFDSYSNHRHAACACAISGASCDSHAGDANTQWEEWTSGTGLPIAPGYYYLTQNVVLSKQYVWNDMDGRGIYICLNGFSIVKQEGTGAGGSMIYVGGSNQTGTMTILNCQAKLSGGKLTSSAGIKNCTAGNGYQGGAITVGTGSLTLLGVAVTGNKNTNTANNGAVAGALLVRGTADKIYLAYTDFYDNHADADGKGQGGALTLEGGKVTIRNSKFHELSASLQGGAISLPLGSKATVSMTDCTVTDNNTLSTNSYGGAIFIGDGTVTMDNVTITGNHNNGRHGSAITLGEAKTVAAALTLTDCTITGNTNKSELKRSAVTVYSGVTGLTIAGSTKIDNNTNNGALSNIFLRGKEAKIRVLQLKDGAYFSVLTSDHNMDEYQIAYPVEDPDAFLIKGIQDAWDPAWKNTWILYENNFAQVNYSEEKSFYFEELTSNHVHCLCGGDNGDNCNHTNRMWLPWDKADSLPTTTGNYYLTKDVKLKTAQIISGTAKVTLCLNGHTVTASSSNEKWVYSLNHDSVLTISDCQASGEAGTYNSGKLTGGTDGCIRLRKTDGAKGATFNLYDGWILKNERNYGGAGVTMVGNGTFNMYGGRISSNKTKVSGGGVAVENNSVMNFYGGTIAGNSTDGNGGGITIKNSTVNLYGGVMENNRATSKASSGVGMGGAIYMESSKSRLNLYGTVITGNYANKGGGILTIGGNLMTMTGGEVKNNTASNNGGGVFIANESSMNYSGGVISGNKAVSGAGMTMYKAKVTMTGGTIRGNTAQSNGAGILVQNGSTLQLRGGKITGNSTRANGMGGGIQAESKTALINMSGGSVSGNSAHKGGGIMVIGGASMEMHGGFVSNNKASDNGGGVFVANNSSMVMSGGTVDSNTAVNGGGFLIYKSTFTMNAGKISGNQARDWGGALYAQTTSEVVMNGGVVESNRCDGNCGGVLIMGPSTGILAGTRIINNYAAGEGGGAMTSGVNNVLILAGSVITGNQAGTHGGGISVKNYSKFIMESGSVSNNTSVQDGGGVYIRKAYGTFSGGQIMNNVAGTQGGGVWDDAVDIQLHHDSFIMSGVTVSGNSAPNGGGLFLQRSTAKLSDITLEGNTAEYGGGLYVGYTCMTYLDQSRVKDNKATQMGGGLYLPCGSRANISNTTLTGNRADVQGGGIWVDDDITMTSVTITGNSAPQTGGMYLAPGRFDDHSYVSTIVKMSGDMIIAENTGTAPDLYVGQGSLIQLTAEGFGPKAKVNVTLHSGQLTRTVYGIYNYEGQDLTYTLTAGDRSAKESDFIVETEPTKHASDGDSPDGIWLAVGGAGVLAVIAAVAAVILKKKKASK